jgi:hypothetical protein
MLVPPDRTRKPVNTVQSTKQTYLKCYFASIITLYTACTVFRHWFVVRRLVTACHIIVSLTPRINRHVKRLIVIGTNMMRHLYRRMIADQSINRYIAIKTFDSETDITREHRSFRLPHEAQLISILVQRPYQVNATSQRYSYHHNCEHGILIEY